MRRLKQLVGLLEVVTRPEGLRAFIKWKPFSITSFRMLRLLRKQGLRFSTIVDGGANKGQFARAATETYPEARVIAFEPLPDVAETLRRNLADRPQVTVHQMALGPEDGSVRFFRKSYTLGSSVLRPLESANNDPVEEIEVPLARLDSVLEDGALVAPVLLKLDLQGYEIEALRGAPRTLDHCDYVLVETAFTRGYENEPVFDDVVSFMREAGFQFERPMDVLLGEDGEVLQIDALFRRASDLQRSR